MVIEVRLLGAFRVSTDRGSVHDALWRGARAKALFKYLAYRAGTAISRDALMDLLWPDLDPETCQNSLHKAVHMLRQTINIALGWNGKELLEFSGGSYALRADGLWVDALQFKRAIFAAKWCERLGDTPAMQRGYEEAVGLYDGELLEDDYLVEWAIPERERLRGDYGMALRKLATLYRESGDVERSAAYFRKLLTADPCAEDAYRALIEMALAMGRRGEALRLYRQCKETLERELSLLPSPELEELIVRL
jgi:DNA-binding SARP family transcriptional activator